MTPTPPSRPAATLRVSDADAAFLALADVVIVDGMPLARRVVDGKVEWVGELRPPLETPGFPDEEAP